MRIDKLLADAGFGTRTEVKKAIKQGKVMIDGVRVKDAKTQVEPGEQQVLFNQILVQYQQEVYLMLNKPKGVISATEDNRHKTVIDLVASTWGHKKLFPIGRLDKDTEGLLILTTDGRYSHELMAPKKHVAKLYRAVIDGFVTSEDQLAFQQGVVLNDGYQTKPATLVIEKQADVSMVTIEIVEGKFHQIKRMFEAVNKKVVELERLRIGRLTIDPALKRGAYRELTAEELDLAREKQTKSKDLL